MFPEGEQHLPVEQRKSPYFLVVFPYYYNRRRAVQLSVCLLCWQQLFCFVQLLLPCLGQGLLRVCAGTHMHVHRGRQNEAKRKYHEADSVMLYLSQTRGPAKAVGSQCAQPLLPGCHDAGNWCFGFTSFGRFNRNEEYQPNSSLNRQYWNPARKDVSNVL